MRSSFRKKKKKKDTAKLENQMLPRLDHFKCLPSPRPADPRDSQEAALDQEAGGLGSGSDHVANSQPVSPARTHCWALSQASHSLFQQILLGRILGMRFRCYPLLFLKHLTLGVPENHLVPDVTRSSRAVWMIERPWHLPSNRAGNLQVILGFPYPANHSH